MLDSLTELAHDQRARSPLSPARPGVCREPRKGRNTALNPGHRSVKKLSFKAGVKYECNNSHMVLPGG